MRPMSYYKSTLRFSSVLLAGIFLSACGGDDETPTEVTLDDLAGIWTATSLVAQPSGGGFGIDLIGANTVATLEITSEGRFTLAAQDLLIGPDVTLTGTFEITGARAARITVDGSQGDPLVTTFDLSGDTLTVTIADAALFDLDGNGTIDQDEAVTLTGTLIR
ncbi:MAG: hypothetical protein PVI01_03745 [Gemmatimonadales bacterium]